MARIISKPLQFLIELGEKRKIEQVRSRTVLYERFKWARGGGLYFERNPGEWEIARAVCAERYKRKFQPTAYDKLVAYLVVHPNVEDDYENVGYDFKLTSRYKRVLECLRTDNVAAAAVVEHFKQAGGITKLLAAHGKTDESAVGTLDDDGTGVFPDAIAASSGGGGADGSPVMTVRNREADAGDPAPVRSDRIAASSDGSSAQAREKPGKVIRKMPAKRQPVRCKALSDERTARVLGYSTKSFWRAGIAGEVEHNGRAVSFHPIGRLPEPFHSEALVCLHNWTRGDANLVIGDRHLSEAMRLSWD